MSSLFRNGALAAKLGSSKVGNRTLGLSNGSLLLVSYIGMLFLLLVFAGSLYALALGAPRWLGAITPLGGLLMIGAWIAVAWAVYADRDRRQRSEQ